MKLSSKALHEAITALSDNGYDLQISLPRKYSGRGMYGKQCIGVVTDQPLKLMALITAQMAEIDLLDEFLNIIGSVAQDSMGYDTVVYFKRVEWPEGVEETEEESDEH